MGVSVLCPGPVNTNIPRGARNRPEHMGGPQIRANEEAVLAERLATRGLDPKKVGERVVDAIRTKTFYAFVSAVPAEVIKARHRRIEEALTSPWVTRGLPITEGPRRCAARCRPSAPGAAAGAALVHGPSGVAHYDTDPRERHVELLGDDLGDRDIDPLAHVHLAEMGTVAVEELKVR